MKRTIFLFVIAVCTEALFAFTADYLTFQYRVSRNINPFGSVTVQEYYAIQEKNSRTEYVYKSTEQQACAHSLFPHSGLPPCWYARRHTERAVPI
jgi:hypothetical protein